MKVGFIRCMQTEDFCPGSVDFKTVAKKEGSFTGVEEDIKIVGFITVAAAQVKKLFCVQEKW